MSYANGRTLFDADSHLLELPDFLVDFADPDTRSLMPTFAGGPIADQLASLGATTAHSPERVTEMVGLGDQLLQGPKNYAALGAFNREERSTALDLLGFKRQVVFPTFAAAASFFTKDDAARYPIARAANRAMVEFCREDERLLAVGVLPLHDPELARQEAQFAIEIGVDVLWVPHYAAGDRSPGHGELDPVWATLAEAGTPFALHVGGSAIQLRPAWMNNGRPIPPDWLGSAENVRGKDMMALHHKVETWVGCLVLDGTFDRHPNLKGLVTELGAAFVPSMLHRLDHCVHGWKKSDPELARLSRKPSETITEHLRFTPYPYENVGQLIELSDPRLYLFSSDYPHIEGGRTPLERFDTWLADADDATKDKFFFENIAAFFAR